MIFSVKLVSILSFNSWEIYRQFFIHCSFTFPSSTAFYSIFFYLLQVVWMECKTSSASWHSHNPRRSYFYRPTGATRPETSFGINDIIVSFPLLITFFNPINIHPSSAILLRSTFHICVCLLHPLSSKSLILPRLKWIRSLNGMKSAGWTYLDPLELVHIRFTYYPVFLVRLLMNKTFPEKGIFCEKSIN